jgi:ankyrin repeat protein
VKRILKNGIYQFRMTLFVTVILTAFFKMDALYADNFKMILTNDDSLQYISNDNEYNLVLACLKGDFEVVSLMISKGANPNTTIDENITPLIYAAQGGHLKICKYLISKGADIHYVPVNGPTVLIAAVKSKNIQVINFFLEKGVDINMVDEYNRSALMYAASYGDTVLVGELLKDKADITLKDEKGIDALMASVINKKDSMVTYLLNKRADPNTKDSEGITPFMIAVNNKDEKIMATLLKFGADINHVSNHKESALTIAIKKNDEALMETLINNGADVNQRLSNALTPLTIANYYKYDDFIIETLENKGAGQNYYPDFRSLIAGPEVNWNFNDLMAGFLLGMREFKFNFDVMTGMQFRVVNTRILMHSSGSKYYQLWERRNYAYIGICKNFQIFKKRGLNNRMISVGINELYTFGNYRGAAIDFESKFVFSPYVDISQTFRNIQVGLAYHYTDFGFKGVSPHRIDISAKIIFSKIFEFNPKSYQFWE